MQNSLVEAALTGAVSADLLNQRDNANKCVALVNRVGFAPVHMMARIAKWWLATGKNREGMFGKETNMQ